MPWHIQKTESGYYVVDDNGRRYSEKPLSKRMASRQLRAIYASKAKDLGIVPILQRRPLWRTKHLPGQHDQSTHSPTGRAAQKPQPTDQRAQDEKPAVEMEPMEAHFEPSRWDKMDIPARKDEWEKLSEAERDKQANAIEGIYKNQNEILADLGERPAFKAGKVRETMAERLAGAKDLIPEQSYSEIETMTTGLDQLLDLQGVSEELRYKIGMESTDALIAQEVESLGRVLGDHGMAHIGGNLNFATEMLQQHPMEDSTDQLAGVAIATIFHDTGYLTDPSRAFLDEGHPRWSKQHYEENIKPMVEEALGGEVAESVGHMIATHADTNIDFDKDPYGSSVRLADNLALFQKEKLPGLLRYVPENKQALEEFATGKVDFEVAKKRVIDNVNKSSNSPKVKEHLLKAANELTPITPKLTLGMFAGEIVRFVWQGDHMAVYLRRQPDFDMLQKVLDLGQKQFDKLIKTYKNKYTFDENLFEDNVLELMGEGGKPVLTAYVTAAEKAMRALFNRFRIPFWRLKHLPGQHDQMRHAPNKGSGGGGDRPSYLMSEEAPKHIGNPTKRWLWTKTANKINAINQEIHDLTNDYREKKSSYTWGQLKKITDRIEELIQQRAPMLQELESWGQIPMKFSGNLNLAPCILC